MMYRAITWLALRRGVDLNDEKALTLLSERVRIELGQPTDDEIATLSIDGLDITKELRHPEVDRAVSTVSRVPGVRRAMVRRQRALARGGGIIMLGRDIGTVVLPDAPVKVYLDASVDERARRRHEELEERGRSRPPAEIKAELEQRDEMDRGRHLSPLEPAADAHIIDTSNLTLEQVIDRVREIAGARK